MTSPTHHTRRAGRPSKALLSKTRIIEEAFALSDERGADFTLAALARRLNVQPAALHHYFPNKEALIAGMRGQLAQRIGTDHFDHRPWHEAVLDWAHAYRDTMGTHPGIIAAIATLPVNGEPESIADYERFATALADDGVPDDDIVPTIVAIESFIIGSALDALTPDDNMRPHTNDPTVLNRAERASRTTAHKQHRSPADAAFDYGLKALVNGLRTLHHQSSHLAPHEIPNSPTSGQEQAEVRDLEAT